VYRRIQTHAGIDKKATKILYLRPATNIIQGIAINASWTHELTNRLHTSVVTFPRCAPTSIVMKGENKFVLII
jgi:hypothetical protein